MRKFYPLSLIFLVTIVFSFSAKSQELLPKQAKEIVLKNAKGLGLGQADIENSIVLNAYLDKVSNTQIIYLQQIYQGIPVYNSIQTIAIKTDKVVSISGKRIYKLEEKTYSSKTLPTLSAREATLVAGKSINLSMASFGNSLENAKTSLNQHKVEFAPSDSFKENIISNLLWMPDDKGAIHLSWQVKLVPINSSDYWLVFVNAKDGSVLKKENLTLYCDWNKPIQTTKTFIGPFNISDYYFPEIKNTSASPTVVNSSNYRVIPYPAESVNHAAGTPVPVNNPWLNTGAGNAATTLGWHNTGTREYAYTRGNNVWAREDTAGNDGAGANANSTTALPNLNFDFVFDSEQDPAIGDNLKFGITNLFYWNNIMHDVTYQYGFDEASGNFQFNNQGRGGADDDFVFADAQDGISKNNANFSVGADGFNPRMQMFLFDGNDPLAINTPTSIKGVRPSTEGNMSTANKLIDVGPVTGDLVLVNDDAAGTTHLACGAIFNAVSLVGKIALLDRGDCNFSIKVKAAQNAGALGVVVINNVANELIIMSGGDNTITIPAVMITLADGDALKTIIQTNTVNITLKAGINLDGDLDNGIIAHEYAHGISIRLSGGAATASCLLNDEQMGEGWSDYFALMMTTNWATASESDGTKLRTIGTYVTGGDPVTGFGIRTYPYTTNMAVNEWTYDMLDDITDSEVHLVGEIWAATLWDLTWNMIQIDGINTNLYNANGTGGNSAALKLVTLGMKLQPCSPGFLDGRDALLNADKILFNGKYNCAIWSAFARRGMGINARQGNSNSTLDQVANFEIPSSAIVNKTVDKTESAQNEILTYTFKVSAQCAAVNNFKIVDTLAANVTYISGGTYNSANRTATFNISSLASSQSQTFTLQVRVNPGTFFATTTLFNEPVAGNLIPLTLTASPTSGNAWKSSSSNHSPGFSVMSTSTAASSDQLLTSVAGFLAEGHTQFSFWHNYNTETGHDGGVVELSTDNGTNWIDAGPYMSQNGYNSVINSNSNLAGKNAFSGSSDGYIQSVINLSAFEGLTVKFRFRFVTDNSAASGGWNVDDLMITKVAAVYNQAGLFNNSSILQSLSDTVTAITAVVLPLSWGEFVVEKEGQTALIKWSTLQEYNTAKFFIERSNDGVNFKIIATVNAAGNSNSIKNYSFTDENPGMGIIYYRIRQTDFDSKNSYSEIRSVFFDEPDGLITISPNPATDNVVVKISGNNEPLQITILNATGQAVKSVTIKEETNNISVSKLAAGVYYLKIKGEKISSVKKLLIE